MRGPGRLALLVSLLLAAEARAFDIEAPGPEPKDVRVALSSPLSVLPGTGYLPVQVELTNDGPAPRGVRVDTTAEQMHGRLGSRVMTAELTVPARSRRTFDLLVPLPSLLADQSAWRTVEIAVQGPGVGPYRGSMSGRAPTGAQPVVGFSPLLPDGAEALAGAVAEEIHAVDVDLELLGADPRGLLGLDALFLTPTEIVRMPTPAQQAIRGYVGQGGTVAVIDVGLEPLSALTRLLPEAAWAEERFGLGRAYVVGEASSQGQPPEAARAQRLGSLAARVIVSELEPRVRSLAQPGSLQKAAPEVSLHAGGIAAFLCAFVLLVGPLNLLVLAPRAHRVRLLWTTPAISVGASALLAGGILLQDGVGGEGERRTLRVLQPETRLEHRYQAQVSRTGLLPFGGFELDPSVHIEPVPPASGERERLAQSGARASGDWFATRTVQAFLLQQTRPSRQRVTVAIAADGTPTLTSELAVPLSNVHYRDRAEDLWHVAALPPGARAELTRVEAPIVALDWLHARASAFPGHIARAAERLGYARGIVFGEAPSAEAWDTHRSLRWTDAPAFVMIETRVEGPR